MQKTKKWTGTGRECSERLQRPLRRTEEVLLETFLLEVDAKYEENVLKRQVCAWSLGQVILTSVHGFLVEDWWVAGEEKNLEAMEM